MSQLFVSALYNLYEDLPCDDLPDTEKWSEKWLSLQFRLDQLTKLLQCDVDLCLFLQPNLLKHLPPLGPRVRLVVMNLTDLPIYKEIVAHSDISLPADRNVVKDKIEYFALMNTKIDFVYYAHALLPEFDHYTWIDGSIFKLIADADKAIADIGIIATKTMPNKIIYPCGERIRAYPMDPIRMDTIYWRFLGSIIIFPNDIVVPFKDESTKILAKCYNEGRLTWEVNIWSYIESHYEEEFIAYKADHDDSMITNLLTYLNSCNGDSHGK